MPALSKDSPLRCIFRVEECEHIRLLPSPPGADRSHLYWLKPNVAMLDWWAGYGADGVWNAELCRAAVMANPIPTPQELATDKRRQQRHRPSADCGPDNFKAANTTGRKRAAKPKPAKGCKEPSRGKRAQAYAGEDSEESPEHDSSGDAGGCAACALPFQPENATRAEARFRLNKNHSTTANRETIFTAFSVAGDGHCLFNAFKASLGLVDTVSDLRRRVVSYMSDLVDSQIKLSALNCHIAREQEANTASWKEIPLFDAGTVSVPGTLDQRFETLFARYSNDMNHSAWAGESEIIALAEIFHVNVAVWNVRGSYAEWALRHTVPDARRTVHLRMARRNHYENTNIDPDFLPQAVVAFDYRRSDRATRPRPPSP